MARRQNLLVQVPQSFREMPRWWGDVEGRQWLDRLPRLVADQCRRWGLELDGPVRHGSNALVVPVRGGAEELVLRMSPPGDDVGQEASALQFWNGQGTVRLIQVDPGASAMLLERLNPARPGSTRDRSADAPTCPPGPAACQEHQRDRSHQRRQFSFRLAAAWATHNRAGAA